MPRFEDVHTIDEAVTTDAMSDHSYHTRTENLEFRVLYEAKRDMLVIYLPGRSTSRRMAPILERLRLWKLWLEKRSFDPAQYTDEVSRNREYLLAMLQHVAGDSVPAVADEEE